MSASSPEVDGHHRMSLCLHRHPPAQPRIRRWERKLCPGRQFNSLHDRITHQGLHCRILWYARGRGQTELDRTAVDIHTFYPKQRSCHRQIHESIRSPPLIPVDFHSSTSRGMAQQAQNCFFQEIYFMSLPTCQFTTHFAPNSITPPGLTLWWVR